jgi:hypothetical protein
MLIVAAGILIAATLIGLFMGGLAIIVASNPRESENNMGFGLTLCGVSVVAGVVIVAVASGILD